jgi:hydroxymethylglutaryl-CoA lyase
MADTAEVLRQTHRRPGISYPVLVPNRKGLDAALAADADEVAAFIAASETFSRKNTNASIAESLARTEELVTSARANGIRVRGYISCVLGCPYEGDVQPAKVADLAKKLFDMGCYEISLGDTVGVGTPVKTENLICMVAEHLAVSSVAVHFHDTWGQALVNILVALQLGVSVIDSSVAGLGGCPYAPGASGNVATEDVVYMLDGMGIATGVDLGKLARVGRDISAKLGREVTSKTARALASSCSADVVMIAKVRGSENLE